jgi:hypothetical protein
MVLAALLFLLGGGLALTGSSNSDVLALAWPGQTDEDFVFATTLTARRLTRQLTVQPGGIVVVRTRLPDLIPGRYRLTVVPEAAGERATRIVVVARTGAVGFTRFLTVLTSPTVRLRVIPGMTVLRDAYGQRVRTLPDGVDRESGVLVTEASEGEVRFVDVRLSAELARTGDPGEVASEPLVCRLLPKEAASKRRPISVPRATLCRLPLKNWGPLPLADVDVHIYLANAGHNTEIRALAAAADGEPTTTTFRGLARTPRGSYQLIFIGGDVIDEQGDFVQALPTPRYGRISDTIRVHIAPLRAGPGNERVIELAFAPPPVAGWGPLRPSFTWQRPAPYVTFNSIRDNPVVGNEFRFLAVKNVRSADTVVGDTFVYGGEKLSFRLFYDNDAAEGGTASPDTAIGTRVSLLLPRTPRSSTWAAAYVVAQNARPRVVAATTRLYGARPFKLMYIPGSCQIWNNALHGRRMSDDVVTPHGAPVGFDKLDGRLPPDSRRSSGYVTVRAVVVMP